ncbi:hypothetical protein [Actinokineospora sp. HUAS TT18]|uniref:hypothetical protein n=1 Tax=Actinokineospora sp. HUAS TT18 TaxID=3447451 RepID=UPI003F5278F4
MSARWADDRLLVELSAAVHADRMVPASFREYGRAAFLWRDASLAELLDTQLTGVRADAVLRALTFVADRVAVEVEIGDEGLFGLVVPPVCREVSVMLGDVVGSVPVDDTGWFAIRPKPTGPVRLRFGAVTTPWFTP